MQIPVCLSIFMPWNNSEMKEMCEIRLGENNNQILYNSANNLPLCTSTPVSYLSLAPLCDTLCNRTGTWLK